MFWRGLGIAYSQLFLVAVALWALAILSVQGINTSQLSVSSRPKTIDSLTYSVARFNPQDRITGQGQTLGEQQTFQTAIAAWQGPIQPLVIQPSDKAPVIFRIPTTEPVVFVGIDDGWIQTPEAFDWLTQHHLPFTLFLTNNGIKNNYDYFKELQNSGMTIQDHTISHPNLSKLSFDQQKSEICTTADIYQSVFGIRPWLLRPPYGAYNDDTLKAAASCGMKAVVNWHVNVGTGDVLFQSSNTHLQPGDIVLMHFRPEFLADIQSLAQQVSDNHLQIGRLEDWIR